jgi:serine protease Do
MHRTSSRWILGVIGFVLVCALFYGVRTDRPRPEVSRPQAAPRVASPAAPVQPTAPQAIQAQTAPTDLSPKAAANAPAAPSFVDLVQTVKPAVVSVRVRSDVTSQVASSEDGQNPYQGTPFERFFRQFGTPGKQQQPSQHFYAQAQGSGFFISPDGYVVTNNHVVANAVQLQIVMDNGKIFDAKVVGTDPKTDLALLKVEGNAFPHVTLADELPKIGEWVIAMGNPFGLGGTVTAGIISAEGRDIGAGPYNDFLQIDAAINRGNSGGPTFGMNGRVIGVNTAIFSPSGGSIGIGFAIPATTVTTVVAQLKERGFVERGYLGVTGQPVTKDVADGLGLQEPEGALVSGIQPDSPAAKASIKVGDVITAIDGNKLKDSRELARRVAGIAPNSKSTITYLRDGKEQTAEVTIGQLKGQPAPKPGASDQPSAANPQTSKLGISVAPAARVMGIGEQGLAVLRVDPNGKGAEIGLSPGDIILQVGGKEISTPSDLARAFDDAAAQKKQHVIALVRRDDQERFVALPVASG